MTGSAKTTSPAEPPPQTRQSRRWRAATLAGLIVVLGAIVAFNTNGCLERFEKQIQLAWRPWAPPKLSWVWGDNAESTADETCNCPVPLGEEVGGGVCRLTGPVHECCCDYGSVEKLNAQELCPLLGELVQQPFFRYFKVNLYCDCPFWPDDGMCSLRDCSVCECEEGEVPRPWTDAEAPPPLAPVLCESEDCSHKPCPPASGGPKSLTQSQTSPPQGRGEDRSFPRTSQSDPHNPRPSAQPLDSPNPPDLGPSAPSPDSETHSSATVSSPPSSAEVSGSASSSTTEAESAVDRTVEPAVKQRLLNIRGWRGFNNPWMPGDDSDVQYSYINLLKNPERYTGYKGEHAHRIWNMIYSQSCFSNMTDKDVCAERKVFYRLISGVHASISAHIADKYLLDEAKGVWGPHLPLFQERLGNEAVKERVQNLYFTYLFVLRAIMKAGPLLANVEYDTGAPEQDSRTLHLVKTLVDNPSLKAACPIPFDEARLWKGADSAQLQKQLQAHFQNITRVMDCVGCEKCKLWGKLQLLGIATSLKILFSAEDCGGHKPSGEAQLQLERNEVIALFNLMERLSHSVDAVRRLSSMLDSGVVSQPVPQAAAFSAQGLASFL